MNNLYRYLTNNVNLFIVIEKRKYNIKALNKILKSMKNNKNPENYAVLCDFIPYYGSINMESAIDQLITSRESTPKEVKLGKAIRVLKDQIPFEGAKWNLIQQAFRVMQVEKLERYPCFQIKKNIHTSIVYQAISSKKLTTKLIEQGVFPQRFWQHVSAIRKSLSIEEQEKEQLRREARALHKIDCIHFSILFDKSKNFYPIEIFKLTGMLPLITVRNAHTGKHACIMSLKLVKNDDKGLVEAFPPEGIFGVRLVHTNLGEHYEKVDQALAEIGQKYHELFEVIKWLDNQYPTQQIIWELMEIFEKDTMKRYKSIQWLEVKDFFEVHKLYSLWNILLKLQIRLKEGFKKSKKDHDTFTQFVWKTERSEHIILGKVFLSFYKLYEKYH